MILFYINIFMIIVINQTVSEMLTEYVTESATENDTESATESATETVTEEMVYKRTDEEENDQLQILHSTPEAAFFIEGCTGLYYNSNRSYHNDTKAKILERTIEIENENASIILGLFSLYPISILLYFETPTGNAEPLNYIKITLGIERNNKALISGYGSYTQFENSSEIIIDGSDFSNPNDQMKLPGMPFYIDINAISKAGVVLVSELRLETEEQPFFQYRYSNTLLKPKFFRIEHDGAIYAHHRCCKKDCSRQTFQRISGCQKYSTRSMTDQTKFDLKYYYKYVGDTNSPFTFNGNFFISRPGKTPLAAKIRLYDKKRQGDFYDVVLTDSYATINQYVSKENVTYNDTMEFEREYCNPVTINVTITTSGRISLTRTHESKPFMIYKIKKTDRDEVTLSEISMSKVYGDANRYDFYYNCTDVLTYFNETPRPGAIHISSKEVKRFNDTRYDLVKIFKDSFNMDTRYSKYYNDEFLQFDDAGFKRELPKQADSAPKTDTMTKIVTGVCSFLFVGFLKYMLSFECVKNMTTYVDEDLIKEYRQGLTTSITTSINTEMNTHLGI